MERGDILFEASKVTINDTCYMQKFGIRCVVFVVFVMARSHVGAAWEPGTKSVEYAGTAH